MPPDLTFDLTAMAATVSLASRVAGLARAGDTIALSGPLGSGKTTFARHFLAARGVTGEVPSPTFSLVQVYGDSDGTPGPSAALSPAVWHFDLYRVEDESEILELGLEEALAEAIVLIEWPERLRRLMPADRLDVALSMADDGPGRAARLAVHGAWRDRRGQLAGAAA